MWEFIYWVIILAVLVAIGGLLLEFGCAAIYGIFAAIWAGISWVISKFKKE